jgi:hypothetical protein
LIESFDFCPGWIRTIYVMDSKESQLSLVSDDSFEIMRVIQVQGMESEVATPVGCNITVNSSSVY